MPIGSLIGIHSASDAPREGLEAYITTEDGRRLRMGSPEYVIYMAALKAVNTTSGKNRIYDGTPEFQQLEDRIRRSAAAKKLFPGMGQ